MTLSVSHSFVSLIPDDPSAALAGEVLPQAHWNALHTLIGTIDVSQGGTGLIFGTSGGIPYFNSVSTMASSAMLPQNAIVLGGGAGGSPTTVASLGTSAQVLHGNPSGPPSFASINPATDFSGPIPGTAGGTGQTTYVKGDILVSPGPSTLNRLPVGTDGFILQADSSQTNGVKWAAGSGSATAGGSNTQVQFNNATVLAGSPNLTWVSPTLSIGVQGTTQGSLFLANTSGAFGTTVRSSNVSSVAWTLTLPANPGSSNQLLVTDGSGTTSWVTRLAPAGSSGQIQYNNGGIFGAFTASGDATINTGTGVVTIQPGVVTYAKMQNVSATSRFLGRITAGAGVVEELTGTQATTLLDIFTTTLKGLTPASGGGTANFLRADGSWQAPPGTASSPGGADTQVQFNSAGAFAGDAGFTYNSASDTATLVGGLVAPLHSGGTTAASTLTLQSTSGAGTTDAIFFKTASQAERMRIENNGRVTLGGVTNQFGLLLEINSAIAGQAGINRWTNDAGGGAWFINKSRGATIGTHTIVQSGDTLGQVFYEGSDGTTFIQGAVVRAEVDGTPGVSDMPGRLVFLTTPDGTASATEKMRIDNVGNVTIGTAALLTTATNGFLYYDSCPGAPSGVPTTYSGRVPTVIDTTNSRYYGYIGGLWVNLTAGAGGTPPGGTSGQIQYNNAGSFAGFTMAGDATVVTSTGVMTIANSAVTYAKIQNISAASLLLGRGSAAGAGVTQEIVLGTNLTMSGTTLNATGGGGTPGGSTLQVQYNAAGSFGGMAGTSWDNTNQILTIAAITLSKRILEKTVTLTDGATPALDASLGNIFDLIAAGDRTIAIPTNASSGQKIIIRHNASGANRTLALNTGAGGFRFGTDITGLTITTSGKADYIGCVYDAADSFWDVVAYTKGF